MKLDLCKDCGQADGLGWWIGRMVHPGSAKRRCHDCYLAYMRQAYAKRKARLGIEIRPRGPDDGRSRNRKVKDAS